MKILYALDLDGVIINSIEECYLNSNITFHGINKVSISEKNLFYKYRGEVGPAFQYYFLMLAINSGINIEENLKKMIDQGITQEAQNFEVEFFKNRNNHISSNFESWIKLNPLTNFGKNLKKIKRNSIIIVTTKNCLAAEKIISFYDIKVQKVYGDEDVKEQGSKGILLNTIFENSDFDEIIFIDDSIKHLETVNNEKIKCYFADWGYERSLNVNIYPIAHTDLF